MRAVRRLTRALAALLLAASAVQADVVHLVNGRRIEGRVVARTAEGLQLEVAGGQIHVPAAQVARVEERLAPQDELAVRVRNADMGDPDVVARLAVWASQRGLGLEARQLEAQADGLRLERKVAEARARADAIGWLDVLAWARERRLSTEVRVWLADRAVAANPRNRAAWEARDLALREQAEAARPKPPAARPDPAGPARPAPPAPAEDREADERVAALERQLAEQEAEAEALRERVGELERRRPIVARRRRQRTQPQVPGLWVGPQVEAPCDAPPRSGPLVQVRR